MSNVAAHDPARSTVQDAAVGAVYRHACNDAAAAAIAQDWAECTRLLQIARAIERAYPAASARARFSVGYATPPPDAHISPSDFSNGL